MPSSSVTPRSRPRSAGATVPPIDGRYAVEDEIARGGSGRLLRVRHLELDKTMALKLLGEATDPEARAAFFREARIAASLDHVHIAQVYDFGEDATRGLYLVAELLAGESAGQRLRREGVLAPIAACDIVLQAVEALDYLHGRGLVHGDIKPGHMFLTRPRMPSQAGRNARETRKSHVRLFDFGLGKPAPACSQTRPAQHRQIEGTPAYLAPELVSGAPRSSASDLYALGCSLFELLAGHPPFVGTVGEVMSDHLRQPVPSLSKLHPTIPGALDGVVHALMAKQPEQRPSDARTVSLSLRACIAMLGGRRRPPPRAHRRSLITEAVTDGMPLGLFIANRAGVILFSNPALERVLAASIDEVRLGQSQLATAFPDIERDARAVVVRGRPIRRRGSAVDGRILQLTLSPHRRDGETVGVCGVLDVWTASNSLSRRKV